jgi:hypothetical protein
VPKNISLKLAKYSGKPIVRDNPLVTEIVVVEFLSVFSLITTPLDINRYKNQINNNVVAKIININQKILCFFIL